MFLRENIIYVQFDPLVYLVKLHIEMKIADLIAKVVRASNTHESGWAESIIAQRESRLETLSR